MREQDPESLLLNVTLGMESRKESHAVYFVHTGSHDEKRKV